jgi:hypothetical protein
LEAATTGGRTFKLFDYPVLLQKQQRAAMELNKKGCGRLLRLALVEGGHEPLDGCNDLCWDVELLCLHEIIDELLSLLDGDQESFELCDSPCPGLLIRPIVGEDAQAEGAGCDRNSVAELGRPPLTLGPQLETFLEKYPFASTRVIANHFLTAVFMIKDILSRALWMRNSHRARCRSWPKAARVKASKGMLSIFQEF